MVIVSLLFVFKAGKANIFESIANKDKGRYSDTQFRTTYAGVYMCIHVIAGRKFSSFCGMKVWYINLKTIFLSKYVQSKNIILVRQFPDIIRCLDSRIFNANKL